MCISPDRLTRRFFVQFHTTARHHQTEDGDSPYNSIQPHDITRQKTAILCTFPYNRTTSPDRRRRFFVQFHTTARHHQTEDGDSLYNSIQPHDITRQTDTAILRTIPYNRTTSPDRRRRFSAQFHTTARHHQTEDGDSPYNSIQPHDITRQKTAILRTIPYNRTTSPDRRRRFSAQFHTTARHHQTEDGDSPYNSIQPHDITRQKTAILRTIPYNRTTSPDRRRRFSAQFHTTARHHQTEDGDSPYNSIQPHDIRLTPPYHDMSRDARKPVFGISDQVRHKPGCTVSEAG